MVTSNIMKIQHLSKHESVLKPEIIQSKLPSVSIKIIDLILGILLAQDSNGDNPEPLLQQLLLWQSFINRLLSPTIAPALQIRPQGSWCKAGSQWLGLLSFCCEDFLRDISKITSSLAIRGT